MASRACHSFVALGVAGILAGCAGVPAENPPPYFQARNIGVPAMLDVAWSETQITPTEAVTAWHVPKPGMTQLGCIDIGAFRQDGTAPRIRAAKDGEAVTIYGTSGWYGGALESHGKILSANGYLDEGSTREYGLVIGAYVAGGYSGGSVVADSDGALVGVVTNSMQVTTGQWSGPAAFALPATSIARDIAAELPGAEAHR